MPDTSGHCPNAARKTVAIVQSNYIPWKGYFDLINSVDEFIILDCVQYTRRDWRNRNRIKTKDRVRWLTIPVSVKGKYYQKICDTQIIDPNWTREHLATIHGAYARAPAYSQYKDAIEELYLNCRREFLSEINMRFITGICGLLGIRTRISQSTDFDVVEGKTERLLDLCKKVGATHYISGPSARGYLDENLFASEGLSVSYFHYEGYPQYEQHFPPFEHAVSIVDLLVHTGSDARRYVVRERGGIVERHDTLQRRAA